MAETKDYFLLYHGKHFQAKEEPALDLSPGTETFSLLAVILMITRKAFEKFQGLKYFSTLCKTLSLPEPQTLNELYTLQYKITVWILKEANRESIQALHDTFMQMETAQILKQVDSKKLRSLFELPSAEKEDEEREGEETEKQRFTFLDEKNRLLETLTLLEEKFTNSHFPELSGAEDLKVIRATLEAQRFSVGITGVMNAGKSTLVNALMGKVILGTSVVPETANLTILKYSEETQAKVHYWSKQEWEKIVFTSETLEAMQDFVLETKEAFPETLPSYIQEPSKVEKLSVINLSSYTSAKDSGKKCNLVKFVELQTDLAFLKESVEIVDTPGLDDPVVQREEITKEYIARCDMLFHLMNVSQSATQKDIEFLIDAVLYQHVGKILIVITRADTVDAKALSEVIAYTKEAVKEALAVQNRQSRLDSILESITFLPLSGKMALDCRTDKEKAQREGYRLEASGILELEAYMRKNLFGNDSLKGKVMLSRVKRQILELTENYTEGLRARLVLFSKSQEELERTYSDFLVEKVAEKETLDRLFGDIAYQEKTLDEYTKVLDQFLTGEFYNLQTTLRQRVVSDVRYSYEKTKKAPQESRLRVIIQTAMKDGIIDVVRDYKYKLFKKCEVVQELCNENFAVKGKIGENAVDLERLFEDQFTHGYLTRNFDLLIQNILAAVQQSKPKQIEALDKQVQEIVELALKAVEEETKSRTETETEAVNKHFTDALRKPLKEREEALLKEERLLSSQISRKKSEAQSAEEALKIHTLLKQMEQIESTLKGDDDVRS